jgi:hypothetical protein
VTSTQPPQQQEPGRSPKGRQRGRRRARQLFCPAHPEQRISGDGRRYLLHLLTSEELRQRGMGDKRARLVIQSYPVLVLHNEWLEELHCPTCGLSRWCHVVRREDSSFAVRWAPRELWEQVAHVDPLVPNPSVGEFTRRQARAGGRRRDGGRLFDPGVQGDAKRH